MNAPNHVIGGTVFTATFSSLFFNVNVLESPWTIGAMAVGCLLPDIDHPRSPMGLLLYPISKPLSKRFPHRTATHSLLALVVVAAVSSILESAFFGTRVCSLVLSIAFLSHVLLDMLTLQGVQFFYPFSKQPCVLIGNRERRIRTGDARGELVATAVFLCWGLVLASSGLHEKGFWTTYNQAFAGIGHLNSEFIRSTDLLEVKYRYRVGSKDIEGTGYCIESTANKATILQDDGDWLVLDAMKDNILETRPEHTGRSFEIITKNVIEIGVDSLNALLEGAHVISLDASATAELTFRHGDHVERTKRLKVKYENGLLATELPSEAAAAQAPRPTFIPDNSHLPKIKSMERERARLIADYEQQRRDYKGMMLQLRNLRQQTAQAAMTIAVRENRTEKIRELEKQTVRPPVRPTKIDELAARIDELRITANLKNAERQQEFKTQSAALDADQPKPTTITGVLKYVVL